MRYFFILGNNPTLSLAEIAAVFGLAEKKSTGYQASDFFIMETHANINAAEIIKTLGGIIKIGIIEKEIKNPADLKKAILEIIGKIKPAGKLKFGLSYYGKTKLNQKALGMKIKKNLRERNLSCRWVVGKSKDGRASRALSSVIVEQNNLIKQGIEVVILVGQTGSKGRASYLQLGRTLAVQPFKELSSRDYGRPGRDDYSGMLPPKLAQIMINLSASPSFQEPVPSLSRKGAGGGSDPSSYKGGIKEDSILDPFCGSGTILTEALLLGYKNVIGADLSPKAIANTEKNIKWTLQKSQYPISNIQYKLHTLCATQLSKHIKPNSIAAIVTEPYLGPARGKINFQKIIPKLEKLYSDALAEFNKIIKPDGKIVMVWPVFNPESASRRLKPNLRGLKILNPIPKPWRNNPAIRLTDSHTIIYGRPGQKIWREIVVLAKP